MGEGVGVVSAFASVSLVCPRTDVIRDKSNKLEIRRENILAIVLYCRKIQRIGGTIRKPKWLLVFQRLFIRSRGNRVSDEIRYSCYTDKKL